MPGIQIGNRTIGPDHPCFVIAELGVNHNGDLGMVRRMIGAAKEAGADAVKIQSFKASDFVADDGLDYEYVSQGKVCRESQYHMFDRLALKPEWHEKILGFAREMGMVLFSTPTSAYFVALLDELGVQMFKMGSDDLTNLELIQTIAQKGKPLILSAGMATMEEVDDAVDAVRKTGNRQFALLQCTSMYPATPEHINLNVMHTFARRFGCVVGFSDHTIGILAALTAVSMGACILEKHFTLDNTLAGPDQWFSSDPEEFKAMVDQIRQIEAMKGSYDKAVTPIEEANYIDCRRSVSAACRIRAGQVISPEMLVLKRPFKGLLPKYMDQVTGRRAARDIVRHSAINWEDLADEQ